MASLKAGSVSIRQSRWARGTLGCRTASPSYLLTTMGELKGHVEHKGPNRPLGLVQGIVPGRKNWHQKKQEEEEALGHSKQPYCVIIGRGQGGVMLGARLKRLAVPNIIIEKNERPGD